MRVPWVYGVCWMCAAAGKMKNVGWLPIIPSKHEPSSIAPLNPPTREEKFRSEQSSLRTFEPIRQSKGEVVAGIQDTKHRTGSP